MKELLSKFKGLNKETFRWARVLAVCVATAGRFKGATLGMLAGTLLKTPEAPRGSPCPSPALPSPNSTRPGAGIPEGTEEAGISAPKGCGPPSPTLETSARMARTTRPAARRAESWERSKTSGYFLALFLSLDIPSVAVLLFFFFFKLKTEFVSLKPSFPSPPPPR